MNFLDEPEIAKKLEYFIEELCWTKVVCNKNCGLISLGCQFAPLSGYGKLYKITLIGSNRIVFQILQEWKS